MISIFKGNAPFKITSPFGERTLNGNKEFHAGIDFVGIDTKEIVTVCDGVVEFAGSVSSKSNLTWQWGNYVKLGDKLGNKFFYCHLASLNVSSGQKVKSGDVIGVQGNTGYSFGSHCHFEMRSSSTGKSFSPHNYLGCPNAIGTYTPTFISAPPQTGSKPNINQDLKPTSKPEKDVTKLPSKPTDMVRIKVGDKVNMTGTSWATGGHVASFVKSTVYTVFEVKDNKVRIGLDGVTTGWAIISDIKKA